MGAVIVACLGSIMKRSKSYQYILDEEGNPKLEKDDLKWAEWMFRSGAKFRKVGSDIIGDIHVSTVFLGLDHGYGMSKEPILWETMIFGGEHDQYQRRYTSLEAAIAGHQEAVMLIRDQGIPLAELHRIIRFED